MNLGLKLWQKLLLTAICFGIAIIGFIIKLPAAFRGFDRELHATFYFCAAAFLNILFAKRNIIIHAIIFGGLYIFGMAIEHAQVFSKKQWQIPHGRYDPEDVKGNLTGLIFFSAIWLLYIAIYYLTRNKENNNRPAAIDANELIYETPQGTYLLHSYTPKTKSLIIQNSNDAASNSMLYVQLVFTHVDLLQIPTNMDNIKIYTMASELEKDASSFSSRSKLFKIKNNSGDIGYIDAGAFSVYHKKPEELVYNLVLSVTI
ncbi:MAG: hypothetical protein EOP53_11095 [Sphingobacteriales bacterium]|nr:MAG: hypothetical protein EOP53_11095 [Sphingobacteriales bacterium]